MPASRAPERTRLGRSAPLAAAQRRSALRRLAGSALLAVMLASVPGTAVAATRPAAAAPPARVLRIPFPQDDGSLTPYTFELGYPLMTLVYDTLEWRDLDGTPQPWLARSVERSADDRRLTVHLTAGVRWQDGVPLTSDDVTFTVAWVRTHPHVRFSGELEALEDVVAPDPVTVVFRLRHPAPGFLDQPLADLPILPRHVWAALPPGQAAPAGLPVGSGPYRLVSHTAAGYRFEANDGYFRGPPAVAALDVPVIHDAEKTIEALEQGRVDMVPATLPTDVQERLQGQGVKVVTGPSYLGTVLLLNTRRPPFDSVAVRRAVALAVDLRHVADAVSTSLGSGGAGAAAQHAVPADHGYLHPDSPWSAAGVLQRTDTATARRELTSLHLPALQLLAPDNDPVKLDAARQVASALARAGVQAEVRQLGRSALSHAVGEDGSAPTFQMAISSSPALAAYDPDLLARLFGSDPRQAPLNYSGYSSGAFDALAAREAAIADPAQRRAAVGDELALLAGDAPVVPLYFAAGAYAYRPSAYAGWQFVKGTGILDKLSFLASTRVPTPTASDGPPPRVPPAVTPEGSGPPVLLLGGMGLVGLGILGAAIELVRQRRR